MGNPFKNFTRRDSILWGVSVVIILISNLITGKVDVLTLTAALIGVTSLIFAAKGNVWAQILMVIFSLLYGVISFHFRYWGEMVTYLGMTMPMAIWSAVTWLKNPSEGNANEVKIQKLTGKHWLWLIISNMIVTFGFYLILRYFKTPNLFFSTLSVTTSFLAACLTMLRSSYYAAAYATNDVILMVLWMLASLHDIGYVPVVVNFAMFLINDLYGFISWKKREQTC